VKAGHPLYSETWRVMRGYADLVARQWHEPDAGIWEIRDKPAQQVHSKLMGWLALDRALHIAGGGPSSTGIRRGMTGCAAARGIPALLLLARSGARPHRSTCRSLQSVHRPAPVRQPARSSSGGDGSSNRRLPRKLSQALTHAALVQAALALRTTVSTNEAPTSAKRSRLDR
jgi:hypothetical protein